MTGHPLGCLGLDLEGMNAMYRIRRIGGWPARVAGVFVGVACLVGAMLAAGAELAPAVAYDHGNMSAQEYVDIDYTIPGAWDRPHVENHCDCGGHVVWSGTKNDHAANEYAYSATGGTQTAYVWYVDRNGTDPWSAYDKMICGGGSCLHGKLAGGSSGGAAASSTGGPHALALSGTMTTGEYGDVCTHAIIQDSGHVQCLYADSRNAVENTICHCTGELINSYSQNGHSFRTVGYNDGNPQEQDWVLYRLSDAGNWIAWDKYFHIGGSKLRPGAPRWVHAADGGNFLIVMTRPQWDQIDSGMTNNKVQDICNGCYWSWTGYVEVFHGNEYHMIQHKASYRWAYILVRKGTDGAWHVGDRKSWGCDNNTYDTGCSVRVNF